MGESITDIMAALLREQPETIRERLDAFTRDLRDRIAETGSASLDNLGRFTGSEDGILFEPDERLALAVNYPYARLETCVATTTLEHWEPKDIEEKPVAQRSEVSAPPSTDFHTPEPVPRATEPVPDGIAGVIPDELPDVAISDEEPGTVASTGKITREPADQPPEVPAADQSVASKRIRPPARAKNRSNALWIVLPLLLVVAVVAGLYAAGMLGPLVPSSTKPISAIDTTSASYQGQATVLSNTDTTAVAGLPTSSGETGGPDTTGRIDTEPPAPTPAIEQASGILSRLDPGFTMIVGSTPDRAQAERELRRLARLGYPLAILSYNNNGVTGYRMAVGLFDTVERADSMRHALSDSLPTGTWIRRIR